MTFYGKVWSLLCRHPARSSFNEGLSQQSQSGIFFRSYRHDVVIFGLHCYHRDSSSWKWITSLNPASDAVAATEWKVSIEAKKRNYANI
ncbi:hypothetical protein T11_14864 [Trichinella zimbabwensis]|uniref:Uncharacterized protein n=1 Tax=Trichinella zimbabwensis TaxID=268475 RepID=A0A0V1GMB5_9BILA|nr:hypothetical protein T11_14864 [Trichinella zimbabwensis]